MKNLTWLRRGAVLLLLATASYGLLCAQETRSGPWVMQSSGTTAGLRGIHAVGGGVAWASGTDGTVLRTEDSGYMWQRCAMPPGAEKLDFRGIWAWDADTAMVMSSGPGDLSRIYKTTDGCSHWRLLYTNPDKDGFWDAMVFWNSPVLGDEEGVLLGDPVCGFFQRFDLRRRGEEIARSKYLNDTCSKWCGRLCREQFLNCCRWKEISAVSPSHPLVWNRWKTGAFCLPAGRNLCGGLGVLPATFHS